MNYRRKTQTMNCELLLRQRYAKRQGSDRAAGNTGPRLEIPELATFGGADLQETSAILAFLSFLIRIFAAILRRLSISSIDGSIVLLELFACVEGP